MQLFCAKLIVPSVKNMAVLIRSNIIETWPGAAKPTSNWTPLVLKPNKVNCVLTPLNVSIAKAITWPTITNAHIGSTDSIESGTQEKPRRSEKSEPTQCA